MKKLLTTLPSTRPDFKSTQERSSSCLSIISRSFNYKQQLNSLLNDMKNALSLRLFFKFRDFEHIFKLNQLFLTDIFVVQDALSFWKLLVKHHQQLSEQQQISLLVKILIELNKRKLTQGDRGNIIQFQKIKNTMKWFIEEIISYEKELRRRIEQQMLQKGEKQKLIKTKEFAKYEEKIKEQFMNMQYIKLANVSSRMSAECAHKEVEVNEKVMKDLHQFKGSKLLGQAKEIVLLKKLAPYNWDKKRTYQNRSLQQDLSRTVELDTTRKMNVIDNLKRVEKEKLKRNHQIQWESLEQKQQLSRNYVQSQLNQERQQVQFQENNKIKKIQQQHAKITNERLNFLRKSLHAFEQHEESEKIKEILNHHHLKVQFENDIQQVISEEENAKQIASKYCTIQTQKYLDRFQRQRNHREKRMHKQILSQINCEEHQQLSPMRNSLVDLYDSRLKLRN